MPDIPVVTILSIIFFINYPTVLVGNCSHVRQDDRPAEEPEEKKETDPSDDLPEENNNDKQDLEEEKQFKLWTRVIDYLIDKLAKLFGIKKK